MTPRAAAPLTGGGAPSFALRLFLLSLTMLFAASVVGYLVLRGRLAPQAPPPSLPPLIWGSTAALLAGGVTAEIARRRIARGDGPALRRWLTATGALSAVFLLLQAPALVQLLHRHEAGRAAGGSLAGLVFFLVLLHALHVVGGLVPLGRLLRRTWRAPRSFTADDHGTVRLTVRYWHFLDVVWLVLLAVFLAG